MGDLRSKRRGGFYWEGKKPYVSVTNVLDVIDKPALRYWFGNQIYWAMVKEPELDEKSAMAKPWETSDKAKSRGTTVHSIVEAWKNIDDVKGLDSEQFGGYAQAFDNWRNDYKVEPLEHERTVKSEKYGYAGTLDLLAMVNGKKALIDVKTNKDANIYKEVQLQLSAYEQGLREEGEFVDVAYALSLGDRGNYNFKSFQMDLDAFLHAKGLWEWANEAKCKKVNYFTGGKNDSKS